MKMKQLILVLVTSFSFSLLGGYVWLGHWSLRPSIERYEAHIDITHKHFQIIQQELENYYKKNGHYPNNEEGLSKLNFPSRISIAMYYHPDLLRGYLDLFSYEGYWYSIPREMKNFYRKNHHVPCTIEDIQNVVRWPQFAEPLEQEEINEEEIYRKADIEFIATQDNFFLSYRGEVFSFWLVPFVYENRNDLDPKLFPRSPHDENSYSIEVAKNIYVYSIGSKYFYQKYYTPAYNKLIFHVCSGFLMITTSVCFIIYWGIKSKKWFSTLIFVIVGLYCANIGYKVNMNNRPECVLYADYFLERHIILPLYQQQIQDYLDQGVITTSRYQNLINASELK